ncbi:MAG: lytic transglycosylase domain-containing protein [Telluria sp.]
MDFLSLAQQCAPLVEPRTMVAILRVESGFKPFAIGVVDGRLERQPRNVAEAVATAQALERDGWNFSVGAAQVNRYNLAKYKLDYERAFDPCASIRAGSGILKECYDRAKGKAPDDQMAWKMAFSCYYSGNFKTGFKADFNGQPSYVNKVLASVGDPTAIPVRGSGQIAPTKRRTPAAVSQLAAPVAVPRDAWSVLGAKEI